MSLSMGVTPDMPNQGAAANHRSAEPSDGSGNLSALVVVNLAFPVAFTEIGR